MSVINQMLKDLDERQSEQQHSQAGQVPQKKPATPWKLITTIVIVLIALNIAGVFIWQLYSENQSLKNSHENSSVQNQQNQQNQKNQQEQQSIEGLENNRQTAKSEQTTTPSPKAAPSEVEKNKPVASIPATKNLSATEEKAVISDNTSEKLSEELTADKNAKQASKDQVVAKNSAVINESSNPSVELEGKHETDNHFTKSETQAEALVKPTLSISRKQLTAAELTQQKINQAEQALAGNELTKAEKLFEDVLLMTPEHKSARKQLAALWFGRQAYQSAINVLSQGIQLYPDDSEFRLMKARIYLNQGQTIAAVNTLKDLPQVESVEYQALLASHAQQISQFGIAATAYQLLAKLEPDAGRWWLGLAVAYDSDSEFDQAVNAYGQAIDKSDLSENARQFARQRIQELGE